MGLMNTFLTLCHHHNELPQKMPAIDEPFTYNSYPLFFRGIFLPPPNSRSIPYLRSLIYLYENEY